MDGWEQQLPVKQDEEVEEILAKRIGRKTRNKEYLEYLVKWKNRGSEDASWVSKEELVHLRKSFILWSSHHMSWRSCFSYEGCLMQEHLWFWEICITQKHFNYVQVNLG
jgi:hypothetical protein